MEYNRLVIAKRGKKIFSFPDLNRNKWHYDKTGKRNLKKIVLRAKSHFMS